MEGLIDDAGRWRSRGVGVMAGAQVMHMAPPASRVPLVMEQLLGWLATTDAHPLIASSVCHYEFEFIHPLSDQRWQRAHGALVADADPDALESAVCDIPVESLVHEHRADCYRAIQDSTRQSDSAPFVEFMLNRIPGAMARSPLKSSPQSPPGRATACSATD